MTLHNQKIFFDIINKNQNLTFFYACVIKTSHFLV